MRTVLDANQYESFYSVIAMIKDECTDIDIQGGVIRQKNDTEIVMYDLDLTDILDNMNIPISNIKPKIDLLRMFLGGDEIVIESDDEKYSIKDEFSKVSFTAPNRQFIDNQFYSRDNLTVIFNFAERDMIFSYTFSSKLCERMKVIANNFNIKAFNIEFNGDTAVMKASPESRDQGAIIANDIVLDTPIEGKTCNITTSALIPEHDSDLELKMYKEGGNVLSSESSFSIKGINGIIYNRTRLMEIE